VIEPDGHNAPRTALVTGAGGGTGRAFVAKLATAGQHVTALSPH
jgi:NAD(P)-dependent dehydrogenase (short-subunit alcohol dehydrogenase family)